MVTTLCKKSTQAINYFARKKDGRINKMKAVKLIWLADRYHLRKYGRPIIGDTYWAMPYGPVGSTTLDIADLNRDTLAVECVEYADKYLNSVGTKKAINIESKRDVDLGVFSSSDIEAFEIIYREFGDKDRFELAEMSHLYPEWSKHSNDFAEGRRRVKIDYMDFFSNSKHSSGVFDIDSEHLAMSKKTFSEVIDIQSMLSS